MPDRDAPVVRYAMAVGTTVAATVLRLSLDPILGDRFPFATLFAAVLIAAWFGGFGPALLASACGAVLSVWLLVAPRGELVLQNPESTGGLALYLCVSLGIAAIGGAMWRARGRAETESEVAAADRERLQVTLSSIGDAVITTDMDARVASMNAVAAELTGWSPGEAVGHPLEEVFRIIDEDTRQPTPNPAMRALAEGRVVGFANHTVLVARDGTERPIDDSAAPIRQPSGEVTGVVLVFRDVTARRAAESRIRTSEQELNDFFENANVALHWVGPDGIIQRANRAELEMLGYESEEYVGRHIADFHVDQDVIGDILARLSGGETLHGYPARLRAKDGSIRDVLINSSVLWDNGRFLHTRCFSLDVTARNRADEAHALLAAVVESSDDAIITKTLDGVITSWNAGAERLFEYTRAEAVGRPITMLIPAERLDEEPRILDRIRRGERIEPFQTMRLAKSGRLINISLRVSPVRDGRGRIIGASKMARDITRELQAERAVRDSEERFRTLADNIAQLAWMADGDGRMFWYNRRWFEYTGTTQAEMDRWGWLAVHHPDHAESVVEKFGRALRSGTPWEDTFPLRGADGSYRWFLSRAVPIRDAAGQVTRWFGTNTDITSQRQAEEALKNADRRKDEFLAVLAHELRNPLAPLRNSLEIMKRADSDEPLRQRSRATIDRQLTHLERLVDDLLDIARISRDHLMLRRDRVDLASIVRHAVEMAQPMAESAGVILTVDVPADPIFLNADAMRLAQVFSNLLHNACKSTDPGGRVSLAARREGDEAIVSVRDTGHGIPPEMLSRVFEMFTQVDQAPERPRGGLGVGLSLVRRLVELHGGSVTGHSEGVRRGSEFVVRLPVAAAATAATSTTAAPPAVSEKPGTRRRVLVVDDNVDAAESLATLLQLSGHEASLAYDGEAAITMAKLVRPDVVLLDIGLPKLSGHDAARAIREQPWGRPMVLVALTGWGQDEDRRKSEAVGFDHHLVKPVDVDALMTLLDTLPNNPSAG